MIPRKIKTNYNEVRYLDMSIMTYQYLTDLKEFHEICIRLNKDSKTVTVSEIFESPISFSFRVFENKLTTIFAQVIKD